jgi:hypothetical protein
MLAVLGVPPANAESNPAQVLGRMLDLYKELKTGDKLRAEPQEFEEVRTDDSVGAQSAYKIGELRLGEHVTSSTLRGYVCKPSDQFAGSTWCVRSKRVREGRGEFTLSESLLESNDGKVVYVNRSYAPAFFDANEINADIERKSRQLSESPRIQRSPSRAGFPDGIIAVWGGVSLKPLEGQALKLVAREQSPNAGFIIDLLNDPALSARSGLPVYATVGPDGVGRLRFLAIDPRQASLRVAVGEEANSLNVAPVQNTASLPGTEGREDKEERNDGSDKANRVLPADRESDVGGIHPQNDQSARTQEVAERQASSPEPMAHDPELASSPKSDLSNWWPLAILVGLVAAAAARRSRQPKLSPMQAAATMTLAAPSGTQPSVVVVSGSSSTAMKVLGVIINLFWPGVGTLVVGKFVTGTIQAVLSLIALLLIFSGIGAVIGIPVALILCIWSVISVVTAR